MSSLPPPARRPDGLFVWSHPAHALALGFGSGLSPWAAGTAGTLWAWVAFALLRPWLDDVQWGVLMVLSIPAAWWACTLTARHLASPDPRCIVIDEIVAFWWVLWLIMPCDLLSQAVAFALFRFFDAVKPGPVGWADRLFHDIDPATTRHAWIKIGWGIVLDDLVAAFCTLLVMAAWRTWSS